MVYNLIRSIVRLFLRIAFRVTYIGTENVPAKGAVIVASNHLSFWDPPVMGCGLNRHIHYMAKEELFEYPVFSWIIRQLKAFPVKRGASDRNAIRTALALLDQGEMVGVFPEGTRSKTGELGKAEAGLSLIAAKAGAMIVPAAIIGTDRIFKDGNWFPHVEVKFGKPIVVEKGMSGKESLEAITNIMMKEIAALLGREYRHG